MKLEFKMDYLRKIYKRYHASSRKEKEKILDEFCQVCSYNRKYAIRLLNGLPPDEKRKHKRKQRKQRKRSYIYEHRVISILEEIWEATGCIWSHRLKAALPLWLPWAKQRFQISPEIESKILSISPSTIDRRLKSKKYRIKKRIYSTTRPGTLLKRRIPIKTDNWDVNTPGFLEVDLVSHCGSKAEGEFIHSLNCTDIYLTWTEARAVMGRGQAAVFTALEEIIDSLLFPIKGIDSDNDGAFINYHLERFCRERKIQFTRSRPYKKDDNAHIEQKNWTHIRKIFGYLRYDSEEALKSMNDLYRNELKIFQNFFQPSVKLIKKVRIGSKLKRLYDKPKTPFQRALEIKKGIDLKKVSELKSLFQSLDPFELSKIIDKKIDRIYQISTKRNETKKTSEEIFDANFKEDFSRYFQYS